MFLVLKNNLNNDHDQAWQPSASMENLQKRAQILAMIRDFFANRGVMEVETPIMCQSSVTSPGIHSIPAIFQTNLSKPGEAYYLQTSPEYAMKRLLAAGTGDIYQISKSFRQGEIGSFHNPEFTMLEWYRLQFDHLQLMDEMDELLQLILRMPKAERLTYTELFQQFFAIDPHRASIDALATLAKKLNIHVCADIDDKDTWLDLLITHHIEAQLGQDRPCFIYDFPQSQAALARVRLEDPPVASRFEVYIKGIELANGFHELSDAREQRARFENNLRERAQLNLPAMQIDEYFLAALSVGLPDCAGVALGVDRLMMIACQANKLSEVLSFDFTRA